MANRLYNPKLNPVRFYEVQPTVFGNYHTKFYDANPYRDLILPWVERKYYSQKWEQTDVIKLQFQSNFQPLQIDLFSLDTQQVVQQSTPSLVVPNVNLPGYFAYEFTIPLSSIPEGCYHFLLTNGETKDLHMVSEPQLIKQLHRNTVLLEYRNSRYKGNVIFETGITFGFRVEGFFGFLDPGANITGYENQTADPFILSSQPFTGLPLTVGGDFGVPDWVVQLFNRIWCCNSVRADGRSFARTEDAKIAFNGEENYPLRWITLPLREGINRESDIIDVDIDTSVRLVVAFNINDTRVFGPIDGTGSSNQIQILSTE